MAGSAEAGPFNQILRMLGLWGPERVKALAEEALTLHAGPGMPTLKGDRKRSAGGIFFYLARGRASAEEWQHIQPYRPPRPHTSASVRPTPQPKPAPQPPALSALPPPPSTPLPALPFQWAERLALLAEIGSERGGASTVKITLIGRPGNVQERQGFVLASMPAMKLPALPKGLPTPPEAQTPHAVYIATKQWRKVAQALQQPEDVLIVEGIAVYDPELRGLAVFATNTTTKLLQSARRAEQQAKLPPAVAEAD